MRELAHQVLALTGSASRLVQRPLPIDDPRQRRPDIRRAREVLGFAPRVPLQEGLMRTIEDFRARLKRPLETAAVAGSR
jgi:UDP-glucuronate decarboxylase